MVGGEPVAHRAASVGAVTPGQPAVTSSESSVSKGSETKAADRDTDAEQALLRAIRSAG